MVMFGDLINKFLTENNFRCIVIARFSLISIVCWYWLCVSGIYSVFLSLLLLTRCFFVCWYWLCVSLTAGWGFVCLWQLDEVLYLLCVSLFVGIYSVCLWQLDEVLSERRQEIKHQQQKELSRIQEEHATRLRNIRQEYENKVRGGCCSYL